MNTVRFMKHDFYLPIGILLILLIVLSGVVIFSKHYVNPFYHEEIYKGQKCLYMAQFAADQFSGGIYCKNKSGELYEAFGTDNEPK